MRRNPSHSDLWISFSVYNDYKKDRQQRKLELIEDVLIFAMAFCFMRGGGLVFFLVFSILQLCSKCRIYRIKSFICLV